MELAALLTAPQIRTQSATLDMLRNDGQIGQGVPSDCGQNMKNAASTGPGPFARACGWAAFVALIGASLFLAIAYVYVVLTDDSPGPGPLVMLTIGLVIVAVPILGLLALAEVIGAKTGILHEGIVESIASLSRRNRQPSDEEWDSIPSQEGMPYDDYLLSEAWRQRRNYMIRSAGHRCQVGNQRGRLDLHHRTYDRLGYELREDLLVLCRECHDLFHSRRSLH
jgi:hypothetical protein